MIAQRTVICGLLLAVSGALHAQTADCPKRDVPLPSRPPQMSETPPADGIYSVDEGYVSAILQVEKRIKRGLAPQPSAGPLRDLLETPLGKWGYEGYLPERTANRVTRFYRSADDAVVAFSEWDYAADVGTIDIPGMDNTTLAGKPAGLIAMRSPSGCVSTTLSWKDERKLYRVELVGPFDAQRQRAMLMEIGEALSR